MFPIVWTSSSSRPMRPQTSSTRPSLCAARASQRAASAANLELNDDGPGFVASDELNPQKARILLMLGLLERRNAKDMQTLFQTNWEG
jgi:L-asparaginase/Glu-tRNA(Gln) amidotransferase subunit D